MANISKSKRGSAHGLIDHDKRTCENHTNEKIDPTLSKHNYNLVPGDPWENYTKRMGEVYCLNRADVNTLANITVSLPKEINAQDTNKFFEQTHKFYQNHFGEENVISSFVHLDETTPHIHIKAIPIYKNFKKNDREQISFDVVCNRKFYKEMHLKLEKHLQTSLGYECGIMNQATLDGNKAISELKKGTAVKELKKIMNEIEQIKIEKTDIGDIDTNKKANFLTKTVTLPKEDYETLKKMAQKGVLSHETEKSNETLRNSLNISQNENKRLDKANKILKKENKVLEKQNTLFNHFIATSGLSERFHEVTPYLEKMFDMVYNSQKYLYSQFLNLKQTLKNLGHSDGFLSDDQQEKFFDSSFFRTPTFSEKLAYSQEQANDFNQDISHKTIDYEIEM